MSTFARDTFDCSSPASGTVSTYSTTAPSLSFTRPRPISQYIRDSIVPSSPSLLLEPVLTSAVCQEHFFVYRARPVESSLDLLNCNHGFSHLSPVHRRSGQDGKLLVILVCFQSLLTFNLSSSAQARSLTPTVGISLPQRRRRAPSLTRTMRTALQPQRLPPIHRTVKYLLASCQRSRTSSPPSTSLLA